MKYTLFAFNLFYLVYSLCPVLDFFLNNYRNKQENDTRFNKNIIDSRNKSNETELENEKYNNTNKSQHQENDTRFNKDIIDSRNKSNETELENAKLGQNDSQLVNGKATFYFRIGDDINGCPNVQTFNDGNYYGPCSNSNNKGVQYNLDSKYWCAIKNAKDYCGATLVVYYKENMINLKIMDECPGCDNNIDMSLEALIELTGSKENACAINQQLPDIKWKILL